MGSEPGLCSKGDDLGHQRKFMGCLPNRRIMNEKQYNVIESQECPQHW